MSDYLFMLDSHLNSEQSKALSEVREAAERAGLNLFLTGGAMRDMMGGFPIRDLDFTLEGGSLKFAKSLTQDMGAEIVSLDDFRKTAEMRFPGGVLGSISMARQEKYAKPAAKPQISAATIHDDLRGRDFTINAIALSLGKASRGLLLDPTNGLGDLARKELRTVGNYTLYDDPSRILRLIRFKTRFGFAVDDRTQSQYQNVREADLAAKIPAPAIKHELMQIALEPSAGDILKALEEEKLISLLSPTLAGPKLNLPGFQKLQKARQSVPFATNVATDELALFLFLLTEKMNPRERAQFLKLLELSKEQTEGAAKLEAKAVKLEKELTTARIRKPSALYTMLHKTPGEILLFILMRSTHRIVLDRVKNYLQKYLPLAQEVTPKDVVGAEPGSAKFQKLYQQLINARLDARPKKVVVEEAPPPPPPPPAGRRSASFAR